MAAFDGWGPLVAALVKNLLIVLLGPRGVPRGRKRRPFVPQGKRAAALHRVCANGLHPASYGIV